VELLPIQFQGHQGRVQYLLHVRWDADTVIRFELDHEYEFDIKMIGTNFSEDLQQYTSHNVHNKLLTIKVRIPGEGHYGLKVHTKGEDGVDFVKTIL
jgi:hypothetical protein